ncbi:type III-B CRISPR module RAMP protein Cmr1 [Sphingobacteriales bacterium UPWRP_1]|nr:type III-B CRISPR module RAMP protein Cmr1 [Sphingobacteriales bacterium TSM_CSM]PSJ78859.1 type III-B CRISPR module RAMP protein Cmr1 [Sphingobacteriales bacterium UPWRP_1]
MHTITFTCETITPMFLSGADGTTPELRAPSIKGALRFWWRAMNGHLANPQRGGIPNLLREDERLFGGVNEGGKSSVLVRVNMLQETPFFGKDIDRTKEGLAYLLYILVHQQKEREGFKASTSKSNKTEFLITLESKGNSDSDLKKGVAAFWLFIFLGALGTRARRGAGAIAVNTIIDRDNILENYLSFIPHNQETMSNFINRNLTEIKRQFPNIHNLNVNNEYSTIAPNHIYTSNRDFATWQEALDDIGKTMKDIRTSTKTLKFTVYDLDKKAAFGLPIGIWQDNPVNFETNQRRASPLWISVIRNYQGRLQWIITHFQGNFMENGDKIVFATKNYKMSLPKKNKGKSGWTTIKSELLDNFITKVKNQSTQINY